MAAGKRRNKGGSWCSARLRRVLLWVGAAAMVAACALLYVERHHIIHPQVAIDRTVYPVIGIDVSNHNGRIDFGRVRADGISFVIVKASEGKGYRDPSFAHLVREARRSGLKVGAYHFFRKKADGRKQAANFAAALAGRRLDLPIVIDVEDWSNDHMVDDASALARLRAMVAALKARGYKVMIYTNGDGYRKYVRGTELNHDYLWLCSFTSPDALKHYRHHLQQFSHWGTVDGIDGEVDMNVFNGSRQKWHSWLVEAGSRK